MEAVKDQADILMIGASYHFPSITVIIDEPPPGQRLIPHPHTIAVRDLSKLPEVIGTAVDTAKPRRMH